MLASLALTSVTACAHDDRPLVVLSSIARPQQIEAAPAAPMRTPEIAQAGTRPEPAVQRQISPGHFTQPTDPAAFDRASASDGVTLTFSNAPIEDVASQILGDILGADFVIDPRATGRITLRSTQPVARGDLPAALDRASAGAD